MTQNIILGFDQGFSAVKVSTAYGEFKFANAVQEVTNAGTLFNAGSKSTAAVYEYNGKKYIIGDKAGTGSKVDYYRDIKYLMNYAPVMLAAAIDKLKEHNITNNNVDALSVGLPLENINYMNEYKEKLRSFVVNGVVYNFNKIFVYAQGVGAYADYIYNWGKDNIDNDEKGFVWDIGENTMILVAYDGYAVKKDGSRQFDKQGISAIYDLIREPVRNKIEREPSIIDLRNILAGNSIKSFGEHINCQDIVGPAVKQYLETTYMSILDKYKEQFSRCDKVILAGGGSRILAPYIDEVFKKSKFYITAPEPEFSNVRGYRHIVMSKIR